LIKILNNSLAYSETRKMSGIKMSEQIMEKAAVTNIQSTIEDISEALLLCDPTDFQAVSKLYNWMVAFKEWAKETKELKAESVLKAILHILEDVLLEEAEDPGHSFEVVTKTISALQLVYRDGNPIDEVNFPAEINTKINPTEGTRDLAAAPILPAHVDEEIFSEFLSQQDGVIHEMETLILTLEKPDEGDSQAALLRLLHSLKGESALMGLVDVEKLCHQTEEYLKDSRSQSDVDILLSVKDWLSNIFNSYFTNEQTEPVETIMKLLVVAENDLPTEAGSSPLPSNDTEATDEPAKEIAVQDQVAKVPASDGSPQEWNIDTELCAEFIAEGNDHLEESDAQLLILESNPQDDNAINTVFRSFHTIKGVAGFLELTEIGTLAHQAENLLDKARKGKIALEGDAMDITFESVDMLKKMLENLAQALITGVAPGSEPAMYPLIERLKSISDSDAADPDSSSKTELKKPEEKPLDKPDSSPIEAREETVKQVVPNKTGDSQAARTKPTESTATAVVAHTATRLKETLKVDAERLDQLVDAIGELVIAESMVSQSQELINIASPGLAKNLSQLDKITRELQSMGTSLRMVTVRSVFQKMARLVRDLSKKSNKEIQFIMLGEETEVDKTVVDKIGDPLIHMIRNAVDHGIENDPHEREAAGKSRSAKIELRAFHKGGNIYIEVEDDGQGLNREAILSKALARGLIKKDQKLTDSEIWSLVLEPGFSTAKKVTEISGRGVGMDVVKRNIESLRGLIEIQSTAGKGSLFSIRLPLTLAIIDGMIVQVGKNRYIVPTLSVKESLQPEPAALSSVLKQGEMLNIHDKLIPIIRLDRLFNIKGAKQDPTEALIVVIEADGKEAGLMVDELLGQQQVVIKSLGETMHDIQGLSGCTIMPDGRVGLILDTSGLIRR